MFRKFMMALAAMLVLTAVAFAEDGAGGARDNYASIGAGLCMGLAVLGGALGQSRAAGSAFEGIARNPASYGKVFVPMIIALALIESLVLLAFVVAYTKIMG